MFTTMRKIGTILIILLAPASFSVFSQNNSGGNSFEVKNFEQLKPLLHQQNDTLYVVNFWATWCAPCVKEVPYFEQIGQKYNNQKVKVLMISMDFPNQAESRLAPFMEKNKMKNRVILLNDPRQNKWIPQVSEEWTGAIPATLVYRNNEREFYQKEFTFDELDEIIQSKLNK
ncbi:MAG: TlpA family protein disulfide reductase [Bacteroidia bacterium]|nr:TlpA family protein disulfide reductase [Bacteroidia bacterium]